MIGSASANRATDNRSIQPREGGSPTWTGEGVAVLVECMKGSSYLVSQQNRHDKGTADCRRRECKLIDREFCIANDLGNLDSSKAGDWVAVDLIASALKAHGILGETVKFLV